MCSAIFFTGLMTHLICFQVFASEYVIVIWYHYMFSKQYVIGYVFEMICNHVCYQKKNMYSKYVFRIYVFNIYIQNITICYHNKTICVQICVHYYMYSIYVFTIPRYTFRVYVISICFEKSKYVFTYGFDICFHIMWSVYVMKLCIPKNM